MTQTNMNPELKNVINKKIDEKAVPLKGVFESKLHTLEDGTEIRDITFFDLK